MDWARNDLKLLGYINKSKRGTWALPATGKEKYFTLEVAQAELAELRRNRAPLRSTNVPVEDQTVDESEEDESPEQLGDLLTVLKGLSPSGFERPCQHILREAGFVDVEVTGKAGDGGIDGHGILRINELVSMRVIFQCKRFDSSVGPGLVRDFRGSIRSGIDKAILLTTGTFTRSAHEEAGKPGLTPIELVDGEQLISLMQRLEIGVKPRTFYDVEPQFFERYS
ncbi:MAG: restriction endonuclease [Armatimonadota bacterium]